MVFSAKGDALAGAVGNTVHVWDVATGGQRRLGSNPAGGQIAALAWSPDGRLLATGGQGYDIRLWDVAAGKGLRRWPASLNR